MKILKINKKEIEENKIKIYETDFSSIGITIIKNKYIVFEDLCTHDGESISEGKVELGCITCPRHQAKFDLLTGKALCMPATEDLHIYKFKETNDTLEIELEDI